MQLPGSIALLGQISSYTDSLPSSHQPSYLVNLPTGEKHVFYNGDLLISNLDASPNKKWLAYSVNDENYTSNRIIILDADAEQIVSLAAEPSWHSFRWLDGERLWISERATDPNTACPKVGCAAGFYSSVFLNPFTQDRIELKPEILPGLWRFEPSPWFSATVYDPTLTRVLYPNYYAEPPNIFYDLENEQEIVRLPFLDHPVWSPEGDYLGVVMYTALAYSYGAPDTDRTDLFLVSRNGELSRLTYFSENSKNRFQGFSWSPDGEKIAFWRYTTDMETANLAVVEVDSGRVTEYSIQSGFARFSIFVPTDRAPVWSPDGNQLLVLSHDGENLLAVIVDLVDRWAAVIAENMIPVAWLN